MLLIECPHCGPRDETEFHYGAQAGVEYPADPSSLSDAEWSAYLFYRDNPAGAFTERWMHAGGCRKWFEAVRDTRTYAFASTRAAGRAKRANGSGAGNGAGGGAGARIADGASSGIGNAGGVR